MNDYEKTVVPPAAFNSERLSHAYIARGTIAETIAMAVVCESGGVRPCRQCNHCGKASRGLHPDIVQINKQNKKRDILVDQIRDLKRDVIRVPGEASMKAYIINEADSMNTAAQNAFLRILEDPPGSTVFILRTDNPIALLPTVRSRCVELKPVYTEEVAPDAGVPADARNLADDGEIDLVDSFFRSIADGNEHLIRLMFRLDKLDKREFALFLTSAREQTLRRLREAAQGNASGRSDESSIPVNILEQADRTLTRAAEFLDLNVNTGHISGMLCSVFMK